MTSTVILQFAVCVFFSLMVYGMREVRILRTHLREAREDCKLWRRQADEQFKMNQEYREEELKFIKACELKDLVIKKTSDDYQKVLEKLDKSVKHIDMAHDEIEYLENQIPCECVWDDTGCASVNCASQRKCECNFKAAQWHGCGIKGCKRPCLECDGQCGAVGTEECKFW